MRPSLSIREALGSDAFGDPEQVVAANNDPQLKGVIEHLVTTYGRPSAVFALLTASAAEAVFQDARFVAAYVVGLNSVGHSISEVRNSDLAALDLKIKQRAAMAGAPKGRA